MTSKLYEHNSAESRRVRAKTILEWWGNYARRDNHGLGVKPQSLFDTGGRRIYIPDVEVERCGQLIGKLPIIRKAIVTMYWSTMFHKVRRKRDLTLATKLMLKQEGIKGLESHKINSVIDDLVEDVAKYVVP